MDKQGKLYKEIIPFVHGYLKQHEELYYDPNHRDDLVSQCLLEITKNIKKYNSNLGALTTFLVPNIKCGIKNYRCFLLNKKEDSLKNYLKIKAAINDLQAMNLNPSVENIAYVTGFTLSKVYKELMLPQPAELVYDETIFDQIPGAFENPENIIYEKESIAEAMQIVSKLSENEQKIIKDYIEYLSSGTEDFQGDEIMLAKAQARARYLRDHK